ncbi:B3 domain-containing protein REM19-like [Argentina anserina]|uniref:B3 domain-containing protein REM19-like n=1 Tax=Argentina anserina TaxID=57926 RepID=UPI00217628C9|nr:B3 domain-containing protein REM19-like [Potentilla anserina]
MGDDPAHRRAKAFKPGKPFFMVTMSPTYVHARYLHLPSAFAKEHLKEQPSEVRLRDSNEIKWPVEFRHSTRARFRVGWWEFVQGNNLKVGDVCVFVLIEKSEFLFDVHFFPQHIEVAHHKT